MAKNCMIYETLNDVKSMKVSKSDDGLMHLSGVFGVCGVMNNNKRIYEKSNYKTMVDRLKKRIDEEGCPGELEHPNSMNITLENVSHKIDSIEIDDNGVVSGTITLLNTPKGKIAQAIVEGGLPLFISSRAQGNIDQRTGNVTLEDLKTYDLVGTPGFSQARLHLNEGQIAESICESMYYVADRVEEFEKDKSEKDINEKMENKELLKRLEYLETRVRELNEELRKRPSTKELADGIQQWLNEEYSQEIVEKLSKEYNSDESIKRWFIESVAPEIQKWITDEYSPVVEKWVKEEYSDGVQRWLIDSYAPEIQKWIVEHYSPEVDKWVTNHVSEAVADSKKVSLETIDETLALLDSKKNVKPVYGRKQNVVESAQVDEPKYIRDMPSYARVNWDMASEDVKESIRRKAKLFNFVNEGAVENFWENVSFEQAVPVKNVYEGLDAISDDKERDIRMRLRKWTNR